MNSRWYEKNVVLNEMFNFIQSLDLEKRQVVTEHLLQILINECDLDLDKEISNVSKCDYSFNRWYDGDVSLFTVFEIIKNLSKEMQELILTRFVSEIVVSLAKKEF